MCFVGESRVNDTLFTSVVQQTIYLSILESDAENIVCHNPGDKKTGVGPCNENDILWFGVCIDKFTALDCVCIWMSSSELQKKMIDGLTIV